MNDLQNQTWPGWKKNIFRFVFCYVLLFVFSFSFPHRFIPDAGSFFSPFFEALARFTGNKILHLQKPYAAELISDSTGFYINALNLIFISLVLMLIWHFAD